MPSINPSFSDVFPVQNSPVKILFVSGSLSLDPIEKLANIVEEKSMWQKFGL